MSEKLLVKILEFTKGHPYYSQLFFQEYIIYKKLKLPVELKFQQILDNVLLMEKNYLEKSWDIISSSKQLKIVVLALIKEGASLYSRINTKKVNISRALHQLKGSGMILQRKNYFEFSDPLLAYWIKRNII